MWILINAKPIFRFDFEKLEKLSFLKVPNTKITDKFYLSRRIVYGK